MATFDYSLSAQYRLRLTCTEGTPNIAANTSPVTYELKITKLAGLGFSQTGTSYWSVTFNGVVIASGSIPGYDFTGYTDLVLASGTTTVTHDTDGSWAHTVAGGFAEASPNIGSGNATGTLTLTVLPRGPQVEFNGAWAQSLVAVEFNGAWETGLMYAEYNGAWAVVA